MSQASCLADKQIPGPQQMCTRGCQPESNPDCLCKRAERQTSFIRSPQQRQGKASEEGSSGAAHEGVGSLFSSLPHRRGQICQATLDFHHAVMTDLLSFGTLPMDPSPNAGRQLNRREASFCKGSLLLCCFSNSPAWPLLQILRSRFLIFFPSQASSI